MVQIIPEPLDRGRPQGVKYPHQRVKGLPVGSERAPSWCKRRVTAERAR